MLVRMKRMFHLGTETRSPFAVEAVPDRLSKENMGRLEVLVPPLILEDVGTFDAA